MKDKAGKLGSGMAWGITFGGVILALILNFVLMKTSLPTKVAYVLFLAIFAATGWAAVFLTKAGKGAGILAIIVGGLAMAIGTYVVASMAVSAAAGAIASANAGTSASAQLAAQGVANVAGAAVGIFAAIVNFVVVLAAGIPGAVVGGNMKARALA
jgi:hypothetical protein